MQTPLYQSVTLFASFVVSIDSAIKDDAEKGRLYTAIAHYSLYGEEPELTGVSAALFELMRPNIDTSNKRRNAGKKGGEASKLEANQKQTESKTQAKNKQNASKLEAMPSIGIGDRIGDRDNIILSDDKSSSSISPKRQQAVTFGYESDAKIHGITSELLTYWKEQFPAVDVEQEIRSAEAWLDSHRTQRKHDIKRFLTSWLTRTQEKARAISGNTYPRQQQRNNYTGFDGNIPKPVSDEEREAYDGF